MENPGRKRVDMRKSAAKLIFFKGKKNNRSANELTFIAS